MSHELIDRYVKEVGQYLPRRQRADVELELRSLLADDLDERLADGGDPKATLVTMLREMGPPSKFALQYIPEQHLINPVLMPIFKMIVKVMVGIVTAVFIIGSFAGWFAGDLETVFRYFQQIIFNFGLIVLILFGIDRWGVLQQEEEAIWNPLSMPKVKDRDRINRGEMIFEVLIYIGVLLIFGRYPEWDGFFRLIMPDIGPIPLLTEPFYRFIPWLTVLWTLDVVLYLWVLRNGRWHLPTRIAEIVLNVAGIVFMAQVVSLAIQTPIFSVASVPWVTVGVLWLILAIVVGQTAVNIYRLFSHLNQPASPPRSKPA